MYRIVVHGDAAGFLDRGEAWLLRREDVHNLILGLAGARRDAPGTEEEDVFYATVEREGEVVGCAMRTPPHKLLVTEFPPEAASDLVAEVASRYETIPSVLGPNPPRKRSPPPGRGSGAGATSPACPSVSTVSTR